jgi:hypothetical protein
MSPGSDIEAADAPPAAAAVRSPPAANEQDDEGGSTLGWLLLAGGALAVGALVLFLLRRRRDEATVADRSHLEPPATARAPDPVPVRPVAAPAPVQPAMTAVPAAAAAVPVAAAVGASAFSSRRPEASHAAGVAAAAPGETGRATLDVIVEPVRAGVTGEGAVVEFELKLGNRGDAAARDVHVTAWLLPAGAESSSMERTLVQQGDAADVSAIEPKTAQRLAASLTLPTAQIQGDAVLPVVAAEARYRHPDGTESTTTARYAVGVLDGDELAHFATFNPSGLHEGVVAQALGEMERT